MGRKKIQKAPKGSKANDKDRSASEDQHDP